MVIGMGRFGSAVAQELMAEGTEVLCVDSDPAVVQRLAGTFERIVSADTTDPEALHQLGAAAFRRVVVGIGDNLEMSILTTSLLSDLGIPEIWAKALSDQHARILARVGAHHVVLPDQEVGLRVAHLVQDSVEDYFAVDGQLVMVKTKLPQEFVGVALNQLGKSSRGVSVVAVRPADAQNFVPAAPDMVLTAGDTVLLMGSPAALKALDMST